MGWNRVGKALISSEQRTLFRTPDPPNQNQVSQPARAPCTAPDGVTGQVCNWIDSVRLESVPLHIQTKVKHLILDGVACLVIGSKLPWSKIAVQGVLDIEGEAGSCTLFGWDKSLSPLNAALLNGTFIQGFELDDVHVDAPWHANSVILPALFAAAEHTGKKDTARIDGSSLLLSTIVGFEIGSRAGRALRGPEMLSRGWHSGAVFGPPAAAAAVSKLLNLSPGAIEDALGTASTQACGLMSAQYESMGKRMQHGFAARNGLFAGLITQRGYTGIDQVFERPYGGYLATFGQGSSSNPQYLGNELVDGLGQDWKGINGIRVKAYNSMGGTHSSIECIADLQEKHQARFSNTRSIRHIEIEQSKAFHAHGGQSISRPVTVTEAQMSTLYIAAVQLLDRSVLIDQFSSSNLNRDGIWDLVDKVSCTWNPDFDAKGAWYTRVSVTFGDGESVVSETATAKSMASLMSEERIREKWRLLMGNVMDTEAIEGLERTILNLESVDDISEMLKVLKRDVHGVLD